MVRCPAAALCGLLVAVLAGSARAHGGGDAELRPVLDPLPRALAGMRVELHETLGSQLVLENPTQHTVEVLDESGVPFLRIGPRGVEGNLTAPAWYRTLGPASPVPASARSGATPRWMHASAKPSHGWFDPRLAPAGVTAASHHSGKRGAELGRFEVPLLVDGERVALSGRFRSEPPATGRYTARLTSPSELAPGVRVTLLPGRAPGLLVHNASERPLLVLGVDGEPFLRIGPEGVDANLKSRTWQRSARSPSRPAEEAPEPAARAPDAGAAPAWRRVAPEPRFSWIEPRALVTSTPGEASAASTALSFRVPMQLGDEPLVVTGVVSWRPLRAEP